MSNYIGKNLIEVEKILDLLENELGNVIADDEEYYSELNFVLSNEQQYVKESKRQKNTLYIVVKFMPATINFGQVVLPITMTAVSEHNNLEKCQRLLLDFSQYWNLKTIGVSDYSVYQIYSSPSVISNFNEVYDGFRSVFSMSGTFLISKNSNECTLYFYTGDDTTEKIESISSQINFSIQLDPQAFYNTQNRTESVAQVGTLAVGVTAYLVSSGDPLNPNLFDKILYIICKNTTFAPDGVNTTFYFDIKYKNGITLTKVPFKLASFSQQQTIGEIPLATVSFTM